MKRNIKLSPNATSLKRNKENQSLVLINKMNFSTNFIINR